MHFSLHNVYVFQVCHILSLVGSTIPFSPFERAGGRPKLLGLGYRFGFPMYFMTGAPPEFEDLLSLRVALLEEEGCWNCSDCKLSEAGFSREDLPDDIKHSTSNRLRLLQKRPALGSHNFRRKVTDNSYALYLF